MPRSLHATIAVIALLCNIALLWKSRNAIATVDSCGHLLHQAIVEVRPVRQLEHGNIKIRYLLSETENSLGEVRACALELSVRGIDTLGFRRSDIFV